MNSLISYLLWNMCMQLLIIHITIFYLFSFLKRVDFINYKYPYYKITRNVVNSVFLEYLLP